MLLGCIFFFLSPFFFFFWLSVHSGLLYSYSISIAYSFFFFSFFPPFFFLFFWVCSIGAARLYRLIFYFFLFFFPPFLFFLLGVFIQAATSRL